MSTNLYKEIYDDLALTGDTVTVSGTLTVAGVSAFSGGISVGAPTGTTAGAVWTSGVPALTAGQKFITLSAGATTYRVPVWDNA